MSIGVRWRIRSTSVVDVVEIPEQRPRRHARSGSDLLGARAEVALLVERQQGVDDRTTVVVAPEATPVSGALAGRHGGEGTTGVRVDSHRVSSSTDGCAKVGA